jgi:hypothetical protein
MNVGCLVADSSLGWSSGTLMWLADGKGSVEG